MGEFLAEVLAAGPGAALSHDSCAELFEVRRWPARAIHVSAPRRRRIAGVITHRTPLRPLDVVVYRGIPVTNVARLLVDLTDVTDAHEILGVIGEAAWRKRLSLDATRGALERANGRRNLHALEEAIERYERGERVSKSRAELAFLRLVGEPRPLSNAHVEGEEVDAHRPERKLIVEVEGDGAGTLVDGWAARGADGAIDVLLWNATLDQSKASGDPLLDRTVTISGLPAGHATLARVDEQHSNSPPTGTPTARGRPKPSRGVARGRSSVDRGSRRRRRGRDVRAADAGHRPAADHLRNEARNGRSSPRAMPLAIVGSDSMYARAASSSGASKTQIPVLICPSVGPARISAPTPPRSSPAARG